MNSHQLLNLGCGNSFHRDWTNVDLVSRSEFVREHDLRTGIPYSSEHFDAVYHSHVLEHLTPDEARAMLDECFRVLKPGGVIRVVVPDLESISRLYLNCLDAAEQGESAARERYNWMVLEMLDQLVREKSGGRMAEKMVEPPDVIRSFLKERLGDELKNCSTHQAQHQQQEKTKRKKLTLRYLAKKTQKLKRKFALRLLPWIDPSLDRETINEALFRRSGEIHRWMYDRYSLRQLLETIGFVDAQAMGATKSHITRFEEYELDACDGSIRKPDSLFMEAKKPSRAIAKAA